MNRKCTVSFLLGIAVAAMANSILSDWKQYQRDLAIRRNLDDRSKFLKDSSVETYTTLMRNKDAAMAAVHGYNIRKGIVKFPPEPAPIEYLRDLKDHMPEQETKATTAPSCEESTAPA